MDVARYIELKEKKAVSLMAVGRKGHFAIGVTRFDSNGGNELEPELERITREQVEATKKAFQEGLASCDELLRDMDSAAEQAAAMLASPR